MKRRIGALVILMLAMLLTAAPAQAAKKGAVTRRFVPLRPGVVYSTYDFTHDGKADKLRLKLDMYDEGWTIYLNGKACGSFWPGSEDSEAYVFAPTSKNAMLMFMEYTSKTRKGRVFRYSGGRFRDIYKKGLGDFALGWMTPEKVTKNTVTVIVSNTGIDNSVFHEDSKVKFRITYCVSSKGKLWLKSRQNPIVGKKNFTALRGFTTGKSRVGDKADGPRVTRGQKVTLKSLYIRKNTSYTLYQIVVNGKTGWINAASWRNNWPLLLG